MSLKVIVNGAKGQMGRLACEAISVHPELSLVGALGREDSLIDAIKNTSADIVVELTRADCVYQNARQIIEAGAHPIIGASGLNAIEIQTLTELCHAKKLGGIIAPNFSIGAILMMEFAARASLFFKDIEITETHHPKKVDAPSGTALKTVAMINQARKSANLNSTDPKAIPIHSLRMSGFVANQQVILGQLGESLTLTHNSIDRACFMPGIILSCLKAPTLDTLVYGLETIITPL